MSGNKKSIKYDSTEFNPSKSSSYTVITDEIDAYPITMILRIAEKMPKYKANSTKFAGFLFSKASLE